jgi:hypothetical protein
LSSSGDSWLHQTSHIKHFIAAKTSPIPNRLKGIGENGLSESAPAGGVPALVDTICRFGRLSTLFPLARVSGVVQASTSFCRLHLVVQRISFGNLRLLFGVEIFGGQNATEFFRVGSASSSG